jgi:putative protease
MDPTSPEQHTFKPELLAPAKNIERLKVAISYGADAVYVGGQRYGLRARADNLTDDELALAVEWAHQAGAKVYITLNAFLHDEDFAGLPAYSQFLEDIGIDAVIVSDLGVLRQVREHCDIPIHLSTQASCLNEYAARLWKQAGAARLILGRELTIEEGGTLRKRADIEIEQFIHGAMCMAFSGHCTISNFTAGRDSNRGGCSQSCRFSYDVKNTSDATPNASTTLLSSKDLWGIRQIPAFFQQGICSVKIEGRMKSSFYVASTCRVYRELIDAYAEGRWNEELIQRAERELLAVPHRDYTTGSLEQAADRESIFTQIHPMNVGTHKALGLVLETTEESIIMQVNQALHKGDVIEFLPFGQAPISWTVSELSSLHGEPLERVPQEGIACLPKHSSLEAIQALNVVRI